MYRQTIYDKYSWININFSWGTVCPMTCSWTTPEPMPDHDCHKIHHNCHKIWNGPCQEIEMDWLLYICTWGMTQSQNVPAHSMNLPAVCQIETARIVSQFSLLLVWFKPSNGSHSHCQSGTGKTKVRNMDMYSAVWHVGGWWWHQHHWHLAVCCPQQCNTAPLQCWQAATTFSCPLCTNKRRYGTPLMWSQEGCTRVRVSNLCNKVRDKRWWEEADEFRVSKKMNVHTTESEHQCAENKKCQEWDRQWTYIFVCTEHKEDTPASTKRQRDLGSKRFVLAMLVHNQVAKRSK